MPQASVLTSTCPAAGFGSGNVSTTISPFLKMAARMGFLRLALLSGILLAYRRGKINQENRRYRDQALGDGSPGSASNCERRTRSRWAVYRPDVTMKAAPVTVQTSGTSPNNR